MLLKNMPSVALSAIVSAALIMPVGAFAAQSPSVDYDNGNGQPITRLTLIANDDNLATNWGEEDGVNSPKLTCKVEVPVAITYVAQSNGNIVGPSDNAAQIRNYANFPVSVANIKMVAGQNVSLVSTAEAADGADEVYLQMKPNNGTLISLADFTASATEKTSGMSDGDGKRPEVADEWNIAAVQSNAGLATATASVLNLNSLAGKIGSFGLLDPAATTSLGQIEWTVKPGSAATTYSITSNDTTHGSFVVSSDAAGANAIRRASAGDTAYIVATPDENYEIDTVTVNGSTVVPSNDVYQFSMPASNAIVAVTFKNALVSLTTGATSVSNSRGSYVLSSSVTGSPEINTATVGDVVYVKTTPAADYQVGEVTVVDEAENSVDVTTVTANEAYSFEVPASAVTVDVEFVPVPMSTLYTMSQLQAISADIRTKGEQSEYYDTFYEYATLGEQVNITFAKNNGTTTARLVDVSEGKGLVFMISYLSPLPYKKMNYTETFEGGWPASDLRAELNTNSYTAKNGTSISATVYKNYLTGMTMQLKDTVAVTPTPITTKSYYLNASSEDKLIDSPNDSYWIPSVQEMYGSWGNVYLQYYNAPTDEGSAQFVYYAEQNISLENNFNLLGRSWSWLRSTSSSKVNYFKKVQSNGQHGDTTPQYAGGYDLCFCL